MQMNGVNIWILFKIALIMPLSGLYAWYLTRLMQRYRIPEPAERLAIAAPISAPRTPATGAARATASRGRARRRCQDERARGKSRIRLKVRGSELGSA